MPNAMDIPLARRLKNAQRYREVIGVLARYGFASFIAKSGFSPLRKANADWLYSRDGTIDLSSAPLEVRLRKAMEELGPTFIKIGQILSTRRDLIPDALADEFARLQADCPKIPFDRVRAALDEQLKGRTDELFQWIDPEPLAAASMAQVHSAVWKDGSEVVIKLLRPDAADQIEADMDALAFVARLTEERLAKTGFSPMEIVAEFREELRRETNLTIEARSTDRMRTAFANDPGIGFPKVYWEATTNGVLTIEKIQGKLLARTPYASIPLEIRKKIVANGARAVFRQTLELGFFHADPHPGNIFIHDDGRVTFIDCGMVGRIGADARQRIAELVFGVATGDARMVMRAAMRMGNVEPDSIDERALLDDVQEVVDQFVGKPIAEIDIAAVLDKFYQILRDYKVRCPADMVLLIKAMGTIEGVARDIEPDYEIIDAAKPFIYKLVNDRYSPKALTKRFTNTLFSYAELIDSLPKQITGILRKIRLGEAKVNFHFEGIERFRMSVEHMATTVAYALLISALLVASSVLLHAAHGDTASMVGTIGLVGFLLAGFLSIGLVWDIWRTRRGVTRAVRDEERDERKLHG
ncbi:MAG: AarF/UbiB family protein [Planctomycetota bacterium]|nr:AarF/UbiB family protein [Planctomycetota bacterium]